LLASVAEFGFAVLQLYRVVDVARDVAKGVAVGGHAEAQPEIVAHVQNHDGRDKHD